MTKQEIEKAIENGESVWVNGIEHKLDKYYFVAEYNNEPTLYLMTCGYEEDDWNNYPVEAITNIYKTKAAAEHYLHHANITRIETLPFLTWEEFKNKDSIILFYYKLEQYTLYHTDNMIILEITNKPIYCSTGVNLNCSQKKIDLTEENFYKIYDECVRLFKEEE